MSALSSGSSFLQWLRPCSPSSLYRTRIVLNHSQTFLVNPTLFPSSQSHTVPVVGSEGKNIMSVLVLKELRVQWRKQACKSQHDSRGRGRSLGLAWPVGFAEGGRTRTSPPETMVRSRTWNQSYQLGGES